MEFAEYVRVARRFWRSILVLTFLGAIAGGALAATATVQYSATSRVLLTGSDGSSLQLAALTYADLVSTREVLAPVAEELALEGWTVLSGAVRGVAKPGTTIFAVVATDEDADRAAALSTLAADSVVAQVEQVASELPAENAVHARVVDPALVPAGADGNSVAINVLGLALVGFVVGGLQALVRDRRSGRR